MLYSTRLDWMTRDTPPSDRTFKPGSLLNSRYLQDIAILLNIGYLEENVVQTLNSSFVYVSVREHIPRSSYLLRDLR
jgi:hypothetical protein